MGVFFRQSLQFLKLSETLLSQVTIWMARDCFSNGVLLNPKPGS